jgi:hypothetical protein
MCEDDVGCAPLIINIARKENSIDIDAQARMKIHLTIKLTINN